MGLVITGGTTITNGNTVTITAWTHTIPAGSGSNPVHSTAARSAMAVALNALLNAGGAGKLRIRASSTTLADITLSNPAFTESGGVLTADLTPALTATAAATGVADNYQALNNAGTVVWSSPNVS